MARVQLVDNKAVFVFVSDANAYHSEWLESVSPTDRHGRDSLDFCNLSGCEQLVRGPTHIAGNRLDLVMTDVPDITDVVVGTPLGTSDHCFVSFVLRVSSLCRSTISEVLFFLKHRTKPPNWEKQLELRDLNFFNEDINWASIDADLFSTSADKRLTDVKTDEMYKYIINICLKICKKHVLPRKIQENTKYPETESEKKIKITK